MSFDKLLTKISQLFKTVKVPYMLVGGFAVAYWGYPRQSLDIDIVIDISPDKYDLFFKQANNLGFIVNKDEATTILKIGNRFVMELDDFRVDIWLPRTATEKNALNRRGQKRLFGRNLSIIAAEDLIIAKLLAGRAKDIEDVKTVLIRQEKKLNNKYLNQQAISLDVLQILNKLRTIK